MSLPRLELLAAAVNARLLKFVVDTLPMEVSSFVCWTDNMVTLHWVKGQEFALETIRGESSGRNTDQVGS